MTDEKLFGHFEGNLDLRPTPPPDKRKWWEFFFPRRPRFTVVSSDFAYVDPQGRRWIVPFGIYVNGVSSPWICWRLMPPFAWREIWASVVHDVACSKKGDVFGDGTTASFEETHFVLYQAMRCRNVHSVRAWIAWKSVRLLGPRF